MIKLLTALGIICLTSSAFAWWQSVAQNSVSGVVFSLAWTNAAGIDSVGGPSINYGTLSLGATDANRVIAIAIAVRDTGANATVTSVTVGGQAFTQVSGAYQSFLSSVVLTDVWYFADGGALGTSANVSVVYNTSTSRSAVYPYRIITTTPIPNTATGTSSLASIAPSQSIIIPSGGGSLAVIGSRNTGGLAGLSWTNATGDGDNFLGGFSQLGSAHTTSTGSVTVTGTIAASTEVALSLVAWSP